MEIEKSCTFLDFLKDLYTQNECTFRNSTPYESRKRLAMQFENVQNFFFFETFAVINRSLKSIQFVHFYSKLSVIIHFKSRSISHFVASSRFFLPFFFVRSTKFTLTIGEHCSAPAVTHYINQSKNIHPINYATKCVRNSNAMNSKVFFFYFYMIFFCSNCVYICFSTRF